MLLPGSFIFSLILLIVSLVASGSWSVTFRATRKTWRFEFYYNDFVIGFFAAALLAAFTVGTFGSDGFGFIDDVQIASKHQWAFAAASGAAFSAGNMFFVAAIYVSGLAAAAPIALGTAVLVYGLVSPLTGSTASSVLMRGIGAGLMFLGVIAGAIAARQWAMKRLAESIQAGKTKSLKRSVSSKPIILGILGGIFLGLAFPISQISTIGEIAVGQYSFMVLFSVGMIMATAVLQIFFINLPVLGKNAELGDYTRGAFSSHVAGFAGGAIAMTGILTGLIVLHATGAAVVDPRLAFGLWQAPVLVVLFWGLFYFRELSGTEINVTTPVALSAAFTLIGLGVLAFAQQFPTPAGQ